jgi:hypothetical protein
MLMMTGKRLQRYRVRLAMSGDPEFVPGTVIELPRHQGDQYLASGVLETVADDTELVAPASAIGSCLYCAQPVVTGVLCPAHLRQLRGVK